MSPPACLTLLMPILEPSLAGLTNSGRPSPTIASTAAKRAWPNASAYHASKWGIEGFAESVAHEVAPFGIRVVIVEPGITKSAIFAKNVDAPNSTGAYDVQYRRLFQFYAAGIANASGRTCCIQNMTSHGTA